MIDISAEHLSKCYMLARSGQRLSDRRLFWMARRRQAFWALKDVSFDVRRGEALAGC